jgi:hypothetical protein
MRICVVGNFQRIGCIHRDASRRDAPQDEVSEWPKVPSVTSEILAGSTRPYRISVSLLSRDINVDLADSRGRRRPR